MVRPDESGPRALSPPGLGRRRFDGRALALAAAGAAGVWVAGGVPGALAWISVAVLPAGILCSRARLGSAAAVPLAWLVTLVASGLGFTPGLAWVSCAVTGAYALGLAIGMRLDPLPSAAGALALGLLLLALPARGGLGSRPWPPAVAARLLDVSPPALLAECAGLDWMRREPIYAGAGTDRFWRAPWRGQRVGPALLLLGLAAAGVARRRACLAAP